MKSKSLCRRYVVEFASEFLDNPLLKEDIKLRIRNIIIHCRRGRLSSVEAVEAILNAVKTEEE